MTLSVVCFLFTPLPPLHYLRFILIGYLTLAMRAGIIGGLLYCLYTTALPSKRLSTKFKFEILAAMRAREIIIAL